ncbi:MAG: cobalamin B12-binding domain-containing protein [Pseudomonadota bacterium]
MAQRDFPPAVDDLLAKVLHDRIVPGLLDLNAAPSVGLQEGTSRKIEFPDSLVVKFSDLLLEQRINEANLIIDKQFNDGFLPSHLVLGLLTDSARHLGEKWCADACSFGDVTLGLSALHQVLRSLDNDLFAELLPGGLGRSILLAPMPKDTHVFGVSVLEAFFRGAGWNAVAEFDPDPEFLQRAVAERHFDIVGLSVSQSEDVYKARSLITALRDHSCNPDLKVMIGGLPFLADPELYRVTGADASAIDAKEALETANAICPGSHVDIGALHHALDKHF